MGCAPLGKAPILAGGDSLVATPRGCRPRNRYVAGYTRPAFAQHNRLGPARRFPRLASVEHAVAVTAASVLSEPEPSVRRESTADGAGAVAAGCDAARRCGSRTALGARQPGSRPPQASADDAVAIATGTAALHLALVAAGVGRATRSGCRDLTFIASAERGSATAAPASSWSTARPRSSEPAIRTWSSPSSIGGAAAARAAAERRSCRCTCSAIPVARSPRSSDAAHAHVAIGRGRGGCSGRRRMRPARVDGRRSPARAGRRLRHLLVQLQQADLDRRRRHARRARPGGLARARHLGIAGEDPGLGLPPRRRSASTTGSSNVAAAIGVIQMQRLDGLVEPRRRDRRPVPRRVRRLGSPGGPDEPWARRSGWLVHRVLPDDSTRTRCARRSTRGHRGPADLAAAADPGAVPRLRRCSAATSRCRSPTGCCCLAVRRRTSRPSSRDVIIGPRGHRWDNGRRARPSARPARSPTPRARTSSRTRDGRVIYVGKAKSLRSRLSNYFAAPETLLPAHPPDGAGRRDGRVDRGAQRGRGAVPRVQPHQGAPAALQHPAEGRQVVPVPRGHARRGVAAGDGHAGQEAQGRPLLRAVRPRVRDPRDARPAAAHVPDPHVHATTSSSATSGSAARASTRTSRSARRRASARSTTRSTTRSSTS